MKKGNLINKIMLFLFCVLTALYAPYAAALEIKENAMVSKEGETIGQEQIAQLEALRDHPNIHAINLNNPVFEPGMLEAMFQAVHENRHIDTLNGRSREQEGNNLHLGNAGAIVLANFIRANTHVHIVDVENIWFQDDGLLAIGHALQEEHGVLRTLNLGRINDEKITNNSWESFLISLSRHSSLLKLILKNISPRTMLLMAGIVPMTDIMVNIDLTDSLGRFGDEEGHPDNDAYMQKLMGHVAQTNDLINETRENWISRGIIPPEQYENFYRIMMTIAYGTPEQFNEARDYLSDRIPLEELQTLRNRLVNLQWETRHYQHLLGVRNRNRVELVREERENLFPFIPRIIDDFADATPLPGNIDLYNQLITDHLSQRELLLQRTRDEWQRRGFLTSEDYENFGGVVTQITEGNFITMMQHLTGNLNRNRLIKTGNACIDEANRRAVINEERALSTDLQLFAGVIHDLDAEIQYYQGLATDAERGGWMRNWFNFAPAGPGPWMAWGMSGCSIL